MATFNDFMQKFVNTDYSLLVGLAQEAARRLLPPCKAVDSAHNGHFMLTSIILSAIAADGVLTGLERKMLRDVLDLDDDYVDKLISMYDSKMPDLVDHFADNMPGDVKGDTVMLVAAIASVDEKINRDETAFIRKLME